MARNGERRPQRPRIELTSPAASPQEAAAIAAAVEQFVAEATPAPAPVATHSRWQRAALEDGVSRSAGLVPRRTGI